MVGVERSRKEFKGVGSRLFFILVICLFLGCAEKQPKAFIHEMINPMTPIKDQGKSQTCWIYAMLGAIETEHLSMGDSVNLSPYYIQKMMEQEPQCPENKRGMGKTLLNLIQKYGIVGFDAMRTADTPAPQYVFMGGVEYTAKEFAHSVCGPNEYIALTSNDDEPYYQEVDIDLPDNWMHDRFYNIPIDSLLAKTERAVRAHHGVCWESKGHAMAIVGIAHDEDGRPYFIMKNSWGTDGPYQGLNYLSFSKFRKQTLAVEMTREAYDAH